MRVKRSGLCLQAIFPDGLVVQLRPEHERVVEQGARLRAALPAYLVRRRALLDEHCPLIAPLLALVRGNDPEPTTTEELCTTGLGAAPLACASYWSDGVDETGLQVHTPRSIT
jgi:hypothetical protein